MRLLLARSKSVGLAKEGTDRKYNTLVGVERTLMTTVTRSVTEYGKKRIQNITIRADKLPGK